MAQEGRGRTLAALGDPELPDGAPGKPGSGLAIPIGPALRASAHVQPDGTSLLLGRYTMIHPTPR
jgi:hypothetical protein